MTESYSELKKLSDEELIRQHDLHAPKTVVGTRHFLDELRSRENGRVSLSVERMTKHIFWLTCMIGVATLVQLGLVVFAR